MSILQFFGAVGSTYKTLERKCPYCHNKQVALPSEMHLSVYCRKCGKPIPPPR
jgi:ribosomal protein S27E